MNHYDALLIDVGTGNLHSVHNALKNLGAAIQVTSDPQDLQQGGRIVLPGVGAFSSFMEGMHQRGLTEALLQSIQRGDPLLGICVGMQALFDFSEEMGRHAGLGLLPGRVVRFVETPELKVPQTGWNELNVVRTCPLFHDLPPHSYAYFNHSYYCEPQNPEDTVILTDYGLQFASAVQRDNVFGVQFHPEKSQQVGQKLLANFLSV